MEADIACLVSFPCLISLKNLVLQNSNIDLEENINVLEKNLFFKLSLYQTPKSLLKFELKKNFLLIIFKELVKLDILNRNTQKYINVRHCKAESSSKSN